MRPARDEDAPKRSYLKRYHFNEHGYTADCEGCARLSAGMASRPHAEACRKRMYEAMRKTEAGEKWLGKADEKINEYCEEQERKREEEEKKEVQPQEGVDSPAAHDPGSRPAEAVEGNSAEPADTVSVERGPRKRDEETEMTQKTKRNKQQVHEEPQRAKAEKRSSSARRDEKEPKAIRFSTAEESAGSDNMALEDQQRVPESQGGEEELQRESRRKRDESNKV